MFLNAIEVKPDGGRVTVSLEKISGQAIIHIEETGPGVSETQVDRIFDPFCATSLVGRGMGLGLSICYPIVKEHGGAIEVDSEPGKGRIFTDRLPLSSCV